MQIRTVEPKRYVKLRIFATLIDYGIYFMLFYIYMWAFGIQTDGGGYTVNGLLALPIPVVWFIYFAVTEAYNGATPGHDICKLTVVKVNAQKLSLGDAFKRRIVDPIDIFIYGIPALICIYNTPKFQRLGDIFADTVVVKKSDLIETEVVF
jgi:uncharacterized RDD family membrane protein YckC